MLRRGYGIVERPEGGVLRSVADLSPGSRVQVRLAQGSFLASVESVDKGGK